MQFVDSTVSDSIDPIGQLLCHIITTYLAQMFSICIIWTNLDANQIGGINFEANENYPRMMWMKYETENDVNRTNIDDFVRIGIENYCQAYIVTPNSAVDFLTSFEAVRYSMAQRYSQTHVVALPTSPDENQNYIHRILQQKSVEDIPNLLIISPTLHLNGTDIAYDLVTTRIDNHLTLQILDTFNVTTGEFNTNADLFPEKLSDLKGKPLRMTTFNYPPYNVGLEVPPGTGNANLDGSEANKSLFVDGTEGLLALEFCRLYNCTLHIILDEEHTWGAIYDNGTGDGSLGNTFERRSDIGMGGQYSWHQFQFFLDLSATFTRSSVTVLCPKPKQRMGLVLLVLPFSNMMWAAEFFTLFACVMAIIMARLVSSRIHRDRRVVCISSSWFEVWTISMLQSTTLVLRHLPETIIVGCALISSMLISSAYSGELAGMTTVPQYEDPIDTNRQFAERKTKWGAWHHAWVTSLEDIPDFPDPIVEYLFNSFELTSIEALGTRSYSDDFCYPLETLQYGHFAIGDFLTVEKASFLRLLRDDFYWGHVVAYQYKTWPLKNLYDMHVLYVVQSGLFKYWETIVTTATKYQNWKVQLAVATSRQKDKPMPISLQFDHICGIFIIWGIGCGMSCVAFVVEVFFVRYCRNWNREIKLEGHVARNY